MKIVVFGANGKVGQLVVAELLRRGHQVRAAIHSGSLGKQENLEAVETDVYDAGSLEAALNGCDIVISTLGSWKTPRKDVLATAMRTLVPAMESRGIERIVSLTGDGAMTPGEKFSPYKRLVRTAMRLVAPQILHDGEAHLATLAVSKLHWTVVRSPVMREQDTISYTLHPLSATLTVSRHAVAQAIVDLAETDEWAMRAPFIRHS